MVVPDAAEELRRFVEWLERPDGVTAPTRSSRRNKSCDGREHAWLPALLTLRLISR